MTSFTESQPRPWLFILKAALLTALLATLASALLIAVSIGLQPIVQTTRPSMWDITKSVLLLLPITGVSCGSYGFLAGLVGVSILKWRKRRIRSTGRLLVESAVTGFMFGLLFPFFDRLLNPPSFSGMQLLLSAPIGMSCAILCALTFRTYLVTRQPSIP
jgi:hypothetical protein